MTLAILYDFVFGHRIFVADARPTLGACLCSSSLTTLFIAFDFVVSLDQGKVSERLRILESHNSDRN